MKKRCVLLYAPQHSDVVVAFRRRGIDVRQCFDLTEVIDHLNTDRVCAVVLASGGDPETNLFAARALARRHPEVTLVAVGTPVPGVALHLTWPLPDQAVFLDWLRVEGAPLLVNEEATERKPFDVPDETTLAEGELDTLIDALDTELLLTMEAPTRRRAAPRPSAV